MTDLEAVDAASATDELVAGLARRYLAGDVAVAVVGPVLARLRDTEDRLASAEIASLLRHAEDGVQIAVLHAELADVAAALARVRAERDALLQAAGGRIPDVSRAVLWIELAAEADRWRAQAYTEAAKADELRAELDALRGGVAASP